MITLDSKKLNLSEEAIQLMDLSPSDRLGIQYVQVTQNEHFPIIGKIEHLDAHVTGNKLTKKLTISFRGMQNDLLSQFGKEFNVEVYKNNLFKLVKK